MKPIVIVGAGAIGGTVGAYLTRSAIPVHFVDGDPEHVARVQQQGLTVQAYNGTFTVSPKIDTPATFTGGLDTVFLCTKALHTEDAMKWISPRLAKTGYVVSLQNGLNELTIERYVGRNRTVGAFINFFSDLLEPGLIHYGGPGKFVIGELNGELTPRLSVLQEQINTFIDPVVSTNVWGYLWSKLAYGAMLFATATTDATMADCIDHPHYRQVLLALAKEITGLATQQGIELYPFDGWDPTVLNVPNEAQKMMDDVSTMMRNNLKVRSGVWRDLAVRRRKTEIDPQYGPVLEIGSKYNYPMPLLTALVAIIHDLEVGSRERGLHNLDLLSEARV